ncbi:MAG TPA: NAD kinase [Propionibacteriaceae bacterium]|nr:NAD kinase [Propionibacteriaceae bacterium]
MTVPPQLRRVAIKVNARRPEALDVATAFVSGLTEAGMGCLVDPEQLDDLSGRVDGADLRSWDDSAAGTPELLVVFGGDGTILRAAEWALTRRVPLLGVNLGHVGFLAELEPSETSALVTRVVHRNYAIERRLVLSVTVNDEITGARWESFAVNEVSIEKGARDRMLEVLASVDHRPVSRWHCDGLLVSTPTGSTAYAFSAGGPVIWPDVEAMLLVPLSAHALFARPMVLSPFSRVDLDLSGSQVNSGVLWCDGARSLDISRGSRITVRRLPQDLLIARTSEQPFANRLVRKFDLPVEGWRNRDVGA